MSAQGRVMILTSKTGGGHISLAESLRDHIQQNCQVQIIDPLSRLVHSHYRTVSRYAMWIWSEEYKRTNTPARALQSQKLLSRLASARLRQEIKAAQPDLIISTHPLLSYSVMRVIERMGKHIPFILLFTDPENLHAAWFIERDITLTMAPTTETARQALSLGFPADRVKVVGWPVREQFTLARKMDGKALLQEKGLDPHLFTVFLQGGGEGAARFAQTVQSVLDASEHVQLILACGTNRLLRERFLGHPRILALPFTKSIASYMAAADVVMGKAGPNMLFESVTLGKPFIATTFIPGQESSNLEFIQRHGLGWVALDHEAQRELLSGLVRHPSRLAAMREKVASYQAWNDEQTSHISQIVCEFLPHTGHMLAR